MKNTVLTIFSFATFILVLSFKKCQGPVHARFIVLVVPLNLFLPSISPTNPPFFQEDSESELWQHASWNSINPRREFPLALALPSAGTLSARAQYFGTNLEKEQGPGLPSAGSLPPTDRTALTFPRWWDPWDRWQGIERRVGRAPRGLRARARREGPRGERGGGGLARVAEKSASPRSAEAASSEQRRTQSCAGVLLPQVSSPAGVPAPGHGGRAGRAAPGDLRRRLGGGRGGAAEQGGGAILRRGPVRAQPRLHAAALRLLRGARGRGAAAGALRGGLRVRRRQRAGNAGIHEGTARCLAGAALPRPLPARAEDQVPHHGHPQACDPEAQRGGHHRQRAEADPGAGAGLLPELGGGSGHLPEFLQLSRGQVSRGPGQVCSHSCCCSLNPAEKKSILFLCVGGFFQSRSTHL
ncbi:nucleoredoxin-like protein 2 isoform X1 [Bos taurus]|uniref:nucleoredoxin-like protein 2 isoform X1 n=1 Tax=Bos taurus TaxID=9913 RepID=UPI000D53BDD4|nr:nucleoredoxin-like protein 2 isoform X1 [Bos taurus]